MFTKNKHLLQQDSKLQRQVQSSKTFMEAEMRLMGYYGQGGGGEGGVKAKGTEKW